MAEYPQLNEVIDQLANIIGSLSILLDYLFALSKNGNVEEAEQFLQDMSARCESE